MSLAGDFDIDRRFGSIARLYGKSAFERFRSARVCIIGIGGVGSWAAESLARSGVGGMTLVDLDMIAESNVNRQVHALGDVFGRAKVDEMADRIRDINPSCVVECIEEFVDESNVTALLERPFQFVIDAIDDTRAKVALIAACVVRGIPIVTAGAAGGRRDPTRVRTSDLSRTVQDPLLARVRQHLRQGHGFPRDPKRSFGIAAIFSDEPMVRSVETACEQVSGRLNCSGYGSSVNVTGTFGFAAAAVVMEHLAETTRSENQITHPVEKLVPSRT